MLQQIILGLIFIGAIIYIGKVIYRAFLAKSNCASNCGKCNAVDFNKIEEQIKSKNLN